MEIRTLSSRIAYENRWMRVREDRIERADGSQGVYGVVEKADYAIVIPREKGELLLVEQYRYPVGERLWEFPQGAWEDAPTAAPEEVARGELAEETGLRAASMTHLGRLYGAYGFCSQAFDVFLASECQTGAPSRSPEEHGMRMGRFTEREVRQMMRDGAIRDAPSIAAYQLLRLSGPDS